MPTILELYRVMWSYFLKQKTYLTIVLNVEFNFRLLCESQLAKISEPYMSVGIRYDFANNIRILKGVNDCVIHNDLNNAKVLPQAETT